MSIQSFTIKIVAFAMAPSPSMTGKEACSSDTKASSELLSNEKSEEQTQAVIDLLHLDTESVKLLETLRSTPGST